MKGAFYDDIPAIQTAVTEVLKNIPTPRKKTVDSTVFFSPCMNDIKKSMHALVDRSKRCIESIGTYFE